MSESDRVEVGFLVDRAKVDQLIQCGKIVRKEGGRTWNWTEFIGQLIDEFLIKHRVESTEHRRVKLT